MKEEQSSPFPSTSLVFQVKHPWEGETISPQLLQDFHPHRGQSNLAF